MLHASVDYVPRFLKKKVYDDPPGSFAVEMTRCRYSAILMKLISISQCSIQHCSGDQGSSHRQQWLLSGGSVLIRTRSLRLALVTATSKLITEATNSHPTLQEARAFLNAKYMKAKGYYVVAGFEWQGEPKKGQLSHVETWTDL